MENKDRTQRIDVLCDKIVNKIIAYRHKIPFGKDTGYSSAEMRTKIARLTNRFEKVYDLRNNDKNLTSLQKSFLDDLKFNQSFENRVYREPVENFEYEQYYALTGAFP